MEGSLESSMQADTGSTSSLTSKAAFSVTTQHCTFYAVLMNFMHRFLDLKGQCALCPVF